MSQIFLHKKNTQVTSSKHSRFMGIRRTYQLYLFILPCIIYFVIFAYIPMYGVQIAFKDFSIVKGIFESEWNGFTNFTRFTSSTQFPIIMRNTITLSLYAHFVSFPIPVIFALLLNQLKNGWLKKSIQTITYLPYFISLVVLVGMMDTMFALNTGVVNHILEACGLERVFFMGKDTLFQTMYVFSGVWKNTGWNAIIFLAALSAISPDLYEAADVDGASRFQKMIHVDIPGILPTILIMFILNMGSIMSVGFEKAYLMQNNLNISWSEVIQTYVYKRGLQGGDFGVATAAGMFESIINLVLLLLTNTLAKKISDTSLF